MLLRSATAVPLDSPAPTRDRLQKAARELEAQFAQMMLKSMRKATLGNALFADNTMYRDMYDQKLSQELTRGKGLGLAPMIVRQLERTLPGAQDATGVTAGTAMPLPVRATAATPPGTLGTGGAFPLTRNLPLAMPASRDAIPVRLPDAVLAPAATPVALRATDNGVSLGAVAPVAAPTVAPLPGSDGCGPDAPLDCSSPEAFVRSIWPHARRTAEQLGVSPKALVAQAALETGWGRRLVGGGESHNLFGIKASGWDGRRVESATHEYIGGARRDQRDSFRAYGSIHESFEDYARLMRNDRYAGALAAGTDADRFAHALQQAGYATDPSYAAKISAIVEGPTLKRALAGLDESATPVRTLAMAGTPPRG